MNDSERERLYREAMTARRAGDPCPLCGTQHSALSACPPRDHDFGGVTYEPDRDRDRLRAQLQRVLAVVKDGEWYTLAELAHDTGDPEASVSARLRDLRKDKFGAHVIEREYVSKGLWKYRMTA